MLPRFTAGKNSLGSLNNVVDAVNGLLGRRAPQTGYADGIQPVKVTQNGGDAGGPAAACTFTYDMKDRNGVFLKSQVALAGPRSLGLKVAPPPDSWGMAYIDDAGKINLLWVPEIDSAGETCLS